MSNQSKLFFEFETVMPRDESELNILANKAAYRRNKRVGALALTDSVKGFRSKEKLWVPYSAGESSTVIYAPEPRVERDKRMAKQRVIDKYKDTDITPKEYMNWARFSSISTEQSLRTKFNGYKTNASEQIRNLSTALQGEERCYDEESISKSEIAVRALSWYYINLKSYSGRDNDGNIVSKRRWIQPRWTNVVNIEMEYAQEYIDNLGNEDLILFYQEAYLSNWKRRSYWQEVQDEHNKFVKARRSNEPIWEEVPLEAYEGEYF